VNVAVTGAFGFIGKHVVADLERRAIKPVLVGRPGAILPPHAVNHRVVELDVKTSVANAFELLGRPDTLIHLAWEGLPNYTSLHHCDDELPAQYRFLKTLVAAGLRNLVVTGTCFEYGMQSGPLNELLPTRPSNPYGYAKDSLRTQLQFLQQQQPFSLTWARLFYLFGDGQAPNSLWSQLNTAVKNGDRIFNMSGGEQLRDYLPVVEVARVLVSLALNGRDNGIINICSGEPISVRRLVESWIAANGWSIELNLGHYPYPTFEPMAFWGDRRKLAACIEESP
jgi:dTDP-6-deoxy-L-talose 4-dehydrogenase (NAD+)